MHHLRDRFNDMVDRHKRRIRKNRSKSDGMLDTAPPPLLPMNGGPKDADALADDLAKLSVNNRPNHQGMHSRQQASTGGNVYSSLSPDHLLTDPKFPISEPARSGLSVSTYDNLAYIAMPTPEPYGEYVPSRTLQHALGASDLVMLPLPAPPRVQRARSEEPQTPQSEVISISSDDNDETPKAEKKKRKPRAEAIHRRRSASSPPESSPTPNSGSVARKKPSLGTGELVQCSGTTKKGDRCRRNVASTPALDLLHPEANTERFCFQHKSELLENISFTPLKPGKDDPAQFDDWIPVYLTPDTKAALMVAISQPLSAHDVYGYIYAFQILDPSSSNVYFKVGRTNNVVKRIDEWSKQCGSRNQVLRGYWPGALDAGKTNLLKGCVTPPGPKGPWCHRLERLVHLELADLIVHRQYLHPHFPNAPSIESEVTSAASSSGKSALRSTPSPARPAGTACTDCGAVHKEIFTFEKQEGGRNAGNEWELVVKPVIKRWGKFIQEYLPSEID